MVFARARGRRVLAALFVLLGVMQAVPASAEPGVPPEIIGIAEGDQTIDPGESRYYKVNVVGFDAGGTFAFSGDGLTADVVRIGASQVRLFVTASPTASGGDRSLTATNPDGLTGTFPGAIFVTGDQGPPDVGTLTGHCLLYTSDAADESSSV